MLLRLCLPACPGSNAGHLGLQNARPEPLPPADYVPHQARLRAVARWLLLAARARASANAQAIPPNPWQPATRFPAHRLPVGGRAWRQPAVHCLPGAHRPMLAAGGAGACCDPDSEAHRDTQPRASPYLARSTPHPCRSQPAQWSQREAFHILASPKGVRAWRCLPFLLLSRQCPRLRRPHDQRQDGRYR